MQEVQLGFFLVELELDANPRHEGRSARPSQHVKARERERALTLSCLSARERALDDSSVGRTRVFFMCV